jgi:hypothetical protein
MGSSAALELPNASEGHSQRVMAQRSTFDVAIAASENPLTIRGVATSPTKYENESFSLLFLLSRRGFCYHNIDGN